MINQWEDDKRRFATLEEAREFCLEMSDSLDIAYRIVDKSGKVVDVIDLEAGFWALGKTEGDTQE
jgi:hypothetical protein